MKIGIYPGTFDPITHGHTDIITRSLRVFDKVVVAVAPNPAKHPLFNLTERLEMVKLVMKDLTQVDVTVFEASWSNMSRDREPMPLFEGCEPSLTLSTNFRWLSSTGNWPRTWRPYFSCPAKNILISRPPSSKTWPSTEVR
jgi:cytidyltransferase-like protein